jgi:hypothetical protein
MARQNQTPVAFSETIRGDKNTLMSSGRAGVVVPCTYIPLLRGDSLSGSVSFAAELGEMPRPLLNGATFNLQAWFVPKTAHPKFTGADEFMNSYMGSDITSLGAAPRTPPAFFTSASGANLTTVAASDFFKTLGIHVVAGEPVHTDLIDAFTLIYNFRTAAHSSRLPLREYAEESYANSTALPRAFWPSSIFSGVVPDYERALIVGNLDLDVIAGVMPVRNLQVRDIADGLVNTRLVNTNSSTTGAFDVSVGAAGSSYPRALHVKGSGNAAGNVQNIYADMAGQTFGVSLADIEKARVTQSFAKLRAAYAGNDSTGFNNDDAIIATLMSGMQVPEDQFNRPWLLDSKRVPVGFGERFATDAANLDVSVVQGRTQVSLSLNVPKQDSGGVIVVTAELLPDRLYEAQSDEWLHVQTPSDLPDALRDVQRVEPVDFVKSRRLDARHTTPDALYGYEPMNNVWNRNTTRLGGAFFQPTAGAAATDQRSGIWQLSIVDPAFTDDHYLAPTPFPHAVFADTLAPAFEFVCSHQVAIRGLTQIGDILDENNDNFVAVETPQADDGI